MLRPPSQKPNLFINANILLVHPYVCCVCVSGACMADNSLAVSLPDTQAFLPKLDFLPLPYPKVVFLTCHKPPAG